jgi:hypothetical protein
MGTPGGFSRSVFFSSFLEMDPDWLDGVLEKRQAAVSDRAVTV